LVVVAGCSKLQGLEKNLHVILWDECPGITANAEAFGDSVFHIHNFYLLTWKIPG
jgi:hypothetical protein